MYEKGDIERALQLFIKVIENYPEHSPALDFAAEILAEMGNESAAKELVMRSVALQPGEFRCLIIWYGFIESSFMSLSFVPLFSDFTPFNIICTVFAQVLDIKSTLSSANYPTARKRWRPSRLPLN